ncbi:DUF2846 domain-containing protein [Methylovorus menthalis]|uniref:DUF2846 domain-containing protein n=1 Tax=Methylovorus menthalis TaxID=1002227 RepID=UPI001E654AC1|nr:DUF2846 domain-containing protein [Methylovorus menthalis]MCB4812098.1 DUF2846 domain-containing protein [Methylovorus menthalis]
MRFFILAVLLLTVVGCASSGAKYQDAPKPDTSTSTVYLYRPGKFLLGAFDAQFTVDGKKTANLSGGSYTYIHVNEGCHHIHQFWPYYANFGSSTNFDFCSKAGEDYYILLDGINVVTWRLTEIEKSNALSDISNCDYIPSIASPLLRSQQ